MLLGAQLANSKTILKLWAFTDELKANKTIEKYEKKYPNVHVKLSLVPTENYLTKIKPRL